MFVIVFSEKKRRKICEVQKKVDFCGKFETNNMELKYNTLKIEGDNNIVIQGVDGSTINIDMNAIEQSLRNSNKEMLQELFTFVLAENQENKQILKKLSEYISKLLEKQPIDYDKFDTIIAEQPLSSVFYQLASYYDGFKDKTSYNLLLQSAKLAETGIEIARIKDRLRVFLMGEWIY